jgi:hypothetical protein
MGRHADRAAAEVHEARSCEAAEVDVELLQRDGSGVLAVPGHGDLGAVLERLREARLVALLFLAGDRRWKSDSDDGGEPVARDRREAGRGWRALWVTFGRIIAAG